MKTKTLILIDWAILILFCLVLFFTLDILPHVWKFFDLFLSIDVAHLPLIFIGSGMCSLLYYASRIKRVKSFSSYGWLIAVSATLFIIYKFIPDPFDKMHLFEYFLLSFLLFKVLHHYIFSTKLYFLGAIFAITIALADETAQFFTYTRTSSLSDLWADFAAAGLGQITIALVIRPKLDMWRFKLSKKRRVLRQKDQWLKRKKQMGL